MKVRIFKGKATGKVKAPPSKSFAHRLLIGCALSGKGCNVEGVIESQDMLATLNCLKGLGIGIDKQGDTVIFSGNKIGSSGEFNCKESGSTLRFFIPIASVLLGSGTFYGTEKLISRGVDIYKNLFESQGIKFTINKNSITIDGKLQGGNYTIAGNVSSQFITGLLFALPLCDTDSTLTVTRPIESQSYINITLQVLSLFGIKIQQVAEGVYKIPGKQRYKAQNVTVEGDWSNAAFLYALKTLGHNVEINGLNYDTVQGDAVCVDLLERVKNFSTNDSPIDLSDCPDLAPVLFSVASAFNGANFTGTKRLAIKESDRAKAMQLELAKFGIKVVVNDNDCTVLPSKLQAPMQTLCGHNDHRIVMALSVLCTLTGGIIDHAEAINKSYPDFFEVLENLGVKVTYEG